APLGGAELALPGRQGLASHKDVIDIRDFGADPTRKDNASQINAAFATAGNGTTVLIPPLTFGYESAGLSITKGIVVTGHGNASRLVYNGTDTAVTVRSNVGANGKTLLRDFALTTTGGTPTRGLLIDNSTFVSVERVYTSVFPLGFDLQSSYVCHLMHVQYDAQPTGDNGVTRANNKTGIRLNLVNACVIDGGSLVFRAKHGITLIASSGNAIRDADVEVGSTPQSGGVGIKILANAGTQSQGNVIHNCWFEDNETGIVLDGSANASFGVKDTSITGGMFTTKGGAWDAIRIVKADRTTVTSPTTHERALATIRAGASATHTVLVNVSSDFLRAGAFSEIG
nr:hypothetical protein [Gemmatimonadota bacterium]